MARGKSNTRKIRVVNKDLVYSETSITKLINNIMLDGKKQQASKIVYTALTKAFETLNNAAKSVNEMINTVFANLEPATKAVKRVLRGRTLMIPQDINAQQKSCCAIKILVTTSRTNRDQKGISMIDSLMMIIVDSYNNTGSAIEMKKSIESAAKENKAYKI